MAKTFDWNKSCSYDPAQKSAFHREARKRLKQLADAIGLPPDGYDLRSNKGGNAVSGEVTLHADAVYVQASQPAFGDGSTGLLIRKCAGRKDYCGDRNNLLPLSTLDDPEALAKRVLRISPGVRPDLETPESDDVPRGRGPWYPT